MIETEHVVWVSEAPMNPRLIKGFTHDVTIADRPLSIDAMNRNEVGEALPRERFPREIYVSRPGSKLYKLPALADAGGFWVVSAATADVLRAFDLGRTSLYPTKAFCYDRKTPLEGEYFCLNFGETKSAFLPEQSPRKEGSPYAKVQTKWTLRVVPRDGDLAVDETALAGPDLWVDPRVRRPSSSATGWRRRFRRPSSRAGGDCFAVAYSNLNSSK